LKSSTSGDALAQLGVAGLAAVPFDRVGELVAEVGGASSPG
jgi:hypothetical protein